MIFQKTTVDAAGVKRTFFDTSKDAAATRRAQLRKDYPGCIVETVPFEFANTKAGLQEAFNRLMS